MFIVNFTNSTNDPETIVVGTRWCVGIVSTTALIGWKTSTFVVAGSALDVYCGSLSSNTIALVAVSSGSNRG